MNTSNNYPSFLKAFLLLIIAMVLQFLFVIIIVVVTKIIDYQIPIGEPSLIAIGNLLSLSIVIVWGRKKRGEDCKIFYQLKSFKPRFFLPLILVALGYIIVASEYSNILFYFFPASNDFMAFNYNFLSRGLVSFIAAGIIAPFTEEFFFRGLILRGFVARYNTRKAILLSSILFAIYHLNFYQFLPAFLIGILLSWVFLRLNSLWPCIFLHAFNNSIIVLMFTLIRLEAPGFPTEEEVLSGFVKFQPFWFNILGLVLLPLGIYYFTKITFTNNRGAIQTS